MTCPESVNRMRLQAGVVMSILLCVLYIDNPEMQAGVAELRLRQQCSVSYEECSCASRITGVECSIFLASLVWPLLARHLHVLLRLSASLPPVERSMRKRLLTSRTAALWNFWPAQQECPLAKSKYHHGRQKRTQ
jgi:hypothetical protein